MQVFLADVPGTRGPDTVVTCSGNTTDLLSNLLGADTLPPHVLDAGIPPCAVTAKDDLNVIMIARFHTIVSAVLVRHSRAALRAYTCARGVR
jgi:hypothetical protein